MVIHLDQADIVHGSQDPYFFSNIDNFKKQTESTFHKPRACQSCPLNVCPHALDDPPPSQGSITDILIVFSNPYWADVQTSTTIPGWTRGTQIANTALDGPFKSKNWWLYRKIIGKIQATRHLQIKTLYGTLCRGKGPPPAKAIKYCAQHYMLKKICAYNPKVILAMGIGAAKTFGFKQCMRDLRGTVRSFSIPNLTVPIIFSHDPSSYFFSKEEYALLSTFMLELEKAIDISINGYRPIDWSCLKEKIFFPKTDTEVETVLTDIASDSNRTLAFDIETTGLDCRASNAAITAISFAWGPEQAAAYSLLNASEKRWELTKNFLELDIKKIAHNAKFDIGYLLGKQNIKVKNLVTDTMLSQHLIDENRGGADDSVTIRGEYTLKKLVWDYMWPYGGYEEKGGVSAHLKKYGTTEGLDPDEMLFYAAIDSLVTWKLYCLQVRMLNDLPLETTTAQLQNKKITALFRFSQSFIPKAVTTLVDIENTGIKLDMPLLTSMISNARQQLQDNENKFKEQTKYIGENPDSINIDSAQHLQKLLYKTLHLPVLKKTKKSGNPSTDATTLEQLEDKHPIVQTILKHRRLKKLLSSFLENWYQQQKNGIVYPSYRLGVAKTGRTSCKNPNVQQLPREGTMLSGYNLKRLIIPRENKVLLGADYAQQIRAVGSELLESPKAYCTTT